MNNGDNGIKKHDRVASIPLGVTVAWQSKKMKKDDIHDVGERERIQDFRYFFLFPLIDFFAIFAITSP